MGDTDKAKKPERSVKRAIAFLFALIAALLVAGSAYAVSLLADTTAITENRLRPASVSCVVLEDKAMTAGGELSVKSNVRIANDGDLPAYIRVKVLVNWLDSDDNVAWSVPAGYSADIDYSGDADWVLHTDGYYYYRNIVQPSTNLQTYSTAVLISSAQQVRPNPAEYRLQVTILADAVQAAPGGANGAAREVWGVDPAAL